MLNLKQRKYQNCCCNTVTQIVTLSTPASLR